MPSFIHLLTSTGPPPTLVHHSFLLHTSSSSYFHPGTERGRGWHITREGEEYLALRLAHQEVLGQMLFLETMLPVVVTYSFHWHSANWCASPTADKCWCRELRVRGHLNPWLPIWFKQGKALSPLHHLSWKAVGTWVCQQTKAVAKCLASVSGLLLFAEATGHLL